MITRILFKLLYKLPVSFFPYVLEYILKFHSCRSEKEKGFGLLIINTHDRSGGAAKIAFQLGTYFINKEPVHLFVKYKDRKEDWIHQLDSTNEKLGLTLSNYLNDQEKKGGWLDFSKISFIKQLHLPFVKQSKIIHFHNLHGGYFSYALLPYLSRRKKLIWTLHDEHAITGHCSFTMQCKNWKSNCSQCNFLSIYPAIKEDNAGDLKRFKKRWIKKSKITFVTPSYWLSQRLKITYPFLKEVHVIPNGIDLALFYQTNKLESRLKFDLPTNKFLVLFIAEYATDNPFKGGETIRELIQLSTNKDIIFVTIGGKTQEKKSNFIELPYIKNEYDLVSLYSACDVMLYPTNADNHPLVIMEAMACKLPVIAPKIGGIPEIISDGEDGWLLDAYSAAEVYLKMLNDIYTYKQNEYNSFISFGEKSRIKIEKKFTLEQMLLKYEALYSKI